MLVACALFGSSQESRVAQLVVALGRSSQALLLKHLPHCRCERNCTQISSKSTRPRVPQRVASVAGLGYPHDPLVLRSYRLLNANLLSWCDIVRVPRHPRTSCRVECSIASHASSTADRAASIAASLALAWHPFGSWRHQLKVYDHAASFSGERLSRSIAKLTSRSASFSPTSGLFARQTQKKRWFHAELFNTSCSNICCANVSSASKSKPSNATSNH